MDMTGKDAYLHSCIGYYMTKLQYLYFLYDTHKKTAYDYIQITA